MQSLTIHTPRAKAQAVRPGTRVVKAKNPKIVLKRKLIKKHSAGHGAFTEKTLAQRAGHLEILKGGKSDRKTQAGARDAKKK
jgi:hypothetical protein